MSFATIQILLARYKFTILTLRMKNYFLGLLILNLSLNSQAQTAQFISTKTTDSNTTTDKSPTIKNQHLLPLFGETTKSMQQIEMDIKFLSDCDQNFESRTEASKFFSDRGWSYLQEGQLDTACYRFNLSWLLNNKNADCYWGLGVVCFQKGYLTDAERILRKGIDIDSNNVGLLVDLATVDVIHFKESKDNWELQEADQLLGHALRLDSTNATAYLKKAVLEYHKKNYDVSWRNLHKVKELDITLLDFDFIRDLAECKPDPLGFFNAVKE